MSEVILESGTTECPCKKLDCTRYGKCAECLAFHQEKKHPPACKQGVTHK